MLKIFFNKFYSLVLLILFAFNFSVVAQDVKISDVQDRVFKEGTDYIVVADNKTESPELREFFSFWCGHCFAMQGIYHDLAEHFHSQAKFYRNPVGMLGGEMGEESVKAFAVANFLGIEDKYVNELFTRIHERGEIPQTKKDFIELFKFLGVPENEYSKDIGSFPTIALAGKLNDWTVKSKIEAVPEILVNGKYLAKMDNIETYEQFEDLLAYLLTLP